MAFENSTTVTDPSHFKSDQQFATWLGLELRQNLSGGKDRPEGISKMGDEYIRKLAVVEATALIRSARKRSFAFAAGLTTHTESSHKHSLDSFAKLAAICG